MRVRGFFQVIGRGNGSHQTKLFDLATSNTEVACVAAVEFALASVLLDHTMLLVIDATFAEQGTFKLLLLMTRRLFSGQVIGVGKSLVVQSNTCCTLN